MAHAGRLQRGAPALTMVHPSDAAAAPTMPAPPASTSMSRPDSVLSDFTGDPVAHALLGLLPGTGLAITVKRAPAGPYLWADEGFARLIGVAHDALPGLSDLDIFGADLAAPLRAAEVQAQQAATGAVAEHRLLREGRAIDARVHRVRARARDGADCLISLWQDLRELHDGQRDLGRALDQIERLQHESAALRQQLAQGDRDRTPGLLQREHFEDQLRREVDLSLREHREFALVLVQVETVATAGAAAREQVCDAVGQLLRANTRAMDTPCRLEAGRFAVLLSGVGLATAHARMEGLRRQCATQVVVHEGQPVDFSVTVGVASFPHTAADLGTLNAAAEGALAEGQRRGGNRVALAAIRFEP